jgi:hypothetical protein
MENDSSLYSMDQMVKIYKVSLYNYDHVQRENGKHYGCMYLSNTSPAKSRWFNDIEIEKEKIMLGSSIVL